MGKKGKRKQPTSARDAEQKTEQPVEVEEEIPAQEEETEVITKGNTEEVEKVKVQGEKEEPEQGKPEKQEIQAAEEIVVQDAPVEAVVENQENDAVEEENQPVEQDQHVAEEKEQDDVGAQADVDAQEAHHDQGLEQQEREQEHIPEEVTVPTPAKQEPTPAEEIPPRSTEHHEEQVPEVQPVVEVTPDVKPVVEVTPDVKPEVEVAQVQQPIEPEVAVERVAKPREIVEEAKEEPDEQNQPLGGMQRSNSKFDLQGQENAVLYRPEFAYDTSKTPSDRRNKMWELMGSYLGTDQKSIQRQIVNHVEYTLARTRFDFDNFGAYQAAAYSVRDRLLESWNDTQQYHNHNDSKKVFYFSLEFLMGRTFQNALVNSDLQEPFKNALMGMGYDLEELYDQEGDAALGNGGLGRLAACFVDSLATLEIPAWGYGIRYEYGIFKQKIIDGYQVEIPDFWLNHGNPWEVERKDIKHPIRFYGTSNKYQDGTTERSKWEGCQQVMAMAYDTPIPGFNTYNTNNLRLWSARSTTNFNFDSFNESDYAGAIKERQEAEYITSVLYPNDETDAGKELRLKQQYFFCSASLYDIIASYKSRHNDRFASFADKNKIQLNDTHPAIGTVELLRILIDEEMLSFEEAWSVVYNTFSYTNHTVLPEALEKWSVDLLGKLLPRHLELIYLINHLYLQRLRKQYPKDDKKISRMSLVEEGYPKKIRMAYLSIVCSHTVNGVAALHTELLKKTIFSEFAELYPGKIQNKTNGVTPRRWIHCCNPKLSALISNTLGGVDEWIASLDTLNQLAPYASDREFLEQFIAIKKENKARLQSWVKENAGVEIPLDSLYDIQVKRIHEYKRQLMNILYVIHRYLSILETPVAKRANKFVARVVMIGGKAAPGYANAKAIIKLITAVSEKVNSDQSIGNLLKVVFLPNYNVSSAQIIIPAAELSQHISTAGTEASGTSNMKFVMNGALIIGTMDGANVEIAQEIGEENMFIFGERVDGVTKIRKSLQEGKRGYVGQRLQKVFDTITSGFFGDTTVIHHVLHSLANGGDHYITCFDFYSYIDAQDVVDRTYRDYNKWCEMAITGIAKSGFFSSDRTIAEYCRDIWAIQPVPVPHPSTNPNTRTRSFANLTDAL